jgi:hypothetical protein
LDNGTTRMKDKPLRVKINTTFAIGNTEPGKGRGD